ncbi:MAG: polysaccharide biosynthesis protein [Verrucomicrobiota bacterium]
MDETEHPRIVFELVALMEIGIVGLVGAEHFPNDFELALARQMIELSGLRPDEDIEIRYVGLRPGEKLFEELKCQGENFRPTRHPRIMSFIHQPESLVRVQSALGRLEADLHLLEPAEIKCRIRQLVPEYIPYPPAQAPEPITVDATGSSVTEPETLRLPLLSFAHGQPVVMAAT